MADTQKLTMQEAATEQIHSAIEHFENQQLACAITLAAAGEGMLPATDKPHFHQKVKALGKALEGTGGATDPNDMITWLKHGTFRGKKCDSATIERLEVMVVIYRAITKFVAIYEKPSQEMEKFTTSLITELQQESDEEQSVRR
jgi:hypothetical protein